VVWYFGIDMSLIFSLKVIMSWACGLNEGDKNACSTLLGSDLEGRGDGK
jgi:hypothetical protein